jgi:hypothetical protein
MESSSALIPPFVGSWKLYFHDPSNTSWQEKDYILLATISSWETFWRVMNAFTSSQFEQGGLFLMKEGYPPLYEHFLNKKGGTYQIQISATDEYRKIFEIYSIAMIQELITKDSKNKIVGVSIGLKRGFYLLKLWNIDAKEYNRVKDIHNYTKATSSILYELHINKSW